MVVDGWIYQIFCGRWEGFSDRGKFLSDIKDLNWERLRELGCGAIYLLGLWDSRGIIVVEQEEGVDLRGKNNRISSMMALRDHTNVHPFIGTNEELIRLIESIHLSGIKVFVDFVPNHTSTQNPWIEEHPEYYQWKDNKIIKEFSGDVAKLNYENPDLRISMQNILKIFVDMGIDGVRCDMAHLVPNDFWQETIKIVKQINKDFVFIAEAYPKNPFDLDNIFALEKAGFDGIYDSILYNNLNGVINEGNPASYITSHLNSNPNRENSEAVRYVGNHDDPPLGNRQFNLLSQKIDHYFESLVVLSLFSCGIPFFFNGFLLGFNQRLAHHWRELLNSRYLEMSNSLSERLEKILESYKKYKNAKWRWQAKDQLIIAKTNSNNQELTIIINLSPNSEFVEGIEGQDIWTENEIENPIPSGKCIFVKT